MVIIVAANTVPGMTPVPQVGYQTGQAPAPAAGVNPNALPTILLSSPGVTRRILQQVPASMSRVLQSNPALINQNATVLQRLPEVMAKNGTIMGVLPQAMFIDDPTMDAWERDASFVRMMCQDPDFVAVANRDPEINQRMSQSQAEATAAAPY
jgi:hypothetical protein